MKRRSYALRTFSFGRWHPFAPPTCCEFVSCVCLVVTNGSHSRVVWLRGLDWLWVQAVQRELEKETGHAYPPRRVCAYITQHSIATSLAGTCSLSRSLLHATFSCLGRVRVFCSCVLPLEGGTCLRSLVCFDLLTPHTARPFYTVSHSAA